MGKLKNKFETEIDGWLRRRRVNYKYEADKIPYVYSGHYTPDFTITTKSGSKIYVEAKGYFRPEDKRKLVAVKKCNPTLDIRFVWYSEVAQYVRWCNKHKFPFAIKTIPTEWIKE